MIVGNPNIEIECNGHGYYCASYWLFPEQDKRTLVGALHYLLKDNEVYCLTLDVDPKHRNQGIGTRLLKHIFTLSPTTRLSVGKGNFAARRLYERLGFEYNIETDEGSATCMVRYAGASS